ncbi:RNA polymerase sigma factor SigJ [Andreprevotia chitinilytica]|uniref:RNA polymerase sigma factor SigJ n=1 Tax=Andreprevotia chitinilytica TaxID=396808 RepID=UPI000A7F55F8|nr:RNA polymerase sigma factor SigJ [Andreprevotia chitinilytica]
MNAPLHHFNAARPRLFGLAYRMLGTRADAEDIVQEAYLRWHDEDAAGIDAPEAWLVTIVTRLAIDRLRVVKREREHYIGPWLAEPLLTAELPSPEWQLEFASDVSLAFLNVLERLGPEERAAFLLREVFDADYADIAVTLAKSEAACRQLVSRASKRVKQDTPRFEVAPEDHLRLLQAFADAATSGDPAKLQALFATEATHTSDGGGKVIAALRVLHGAERLARLYQVLAGNFAGRVRFETTELNGELGLLRYTDGQLDSVMTFVTDGVQIVGIYTVRNPDKLSGLGKIAP